ncbi:Armadillo-type fold [Pseudocohnilembus persalinus]|uniref:Armadillo-type fold n=1 Tax=Pseudocohnilembus persalinus TaxID=266149 RepID=A0A0V0QHG6_PSEPJ|nr:Armadillo-type fold [Pseudocohnilembus persalinus]|eukprot:KRX01608.1 Armadillo-type fold [Pseudocohnilembus persalinus]
MEQISTENVKNKYIELCKSQNTKTREIANQFLIELERSPQAWSIAQDLIQNPQNQNKSIEQMFLPQIQFMGCQLIYKKTKLEFIQLDAQHVQQLKNFIFELLSGQNQYQLTQPCFKQLCAALGILGLFGINSTWKNMFSDIIAYMQQGSDQLYLGLEILESFANDIDVIILDQGSLSEIKKTVKQQQGQLLEIFNSLISMQDRPQLALKGLNCLTCFCKSGFKIQPLTQDNTVKNVALALFNHSQNEDFLLQVRDFFDEVFQNSKARNILMILSMGGEEKLEQKEQENIQIIIEMLKKMQEQFKQCMNNKNQNFIYCKTFADILSSFLVNFTHLLLENNGQTGIQLIQMLLETLQHKSLQIALISVDTWCDLKNKLKKYISQQQYSYLGEGYKQALQIGLSQARYRKVEDKEKFEKEQYDNGDDDCQYDDIKFNDFRSAVADLCLSSLNIFTNQNQSGGISYFEGLILQLLQTPKESPEYLLNFEVAIFGLKSVSDDDNYFDKKSEFMSNVFRYILSDQFPQDYFVVSTVLQFFYEFCLSIKHDLSILGDVLGYIQKNLEIPSNRSLASQALQSVIDVVESHNNIEAFKKLVHSLPNYLDSLDDELSIENITTSVFTFALKLESTEHKKEGFNTIFQIVEGKMIPFFLVLRENNQQQIEQQYKNILNILVSIFKGFDVYQQQQMELVADNLQEFLIRNIDFINLFYEKCGSLQISKFVQLLVGVIKRCRNKLPEKFTIFLDQSIKFFQQDPVKYYQYLQIIYNLFDQLKKKNNQAFNQWILQNYRQFNQCVIQAIKTTLDVDVIREWIKITKKATEYDGDLIHNLTDFEELMGVILDVLKNIINYELNRETLVFFLGYLKTPSIKTNQKFINLLPQILETIFYAFPELTKTLIHQITLVLNELGVQFKDNIQNIQQIIYNVVFNLKCYKDFIKQGDTQEYIQQYDQYRQLFVQALGQFMVVPHSNQKIKNTLADFHDLINRYISLSEAYNALQMKLQTQISV